MSDRPEKACVNCHFFAVKQTTTANLRSAKQEEREAAREADFQWKNEANHIACYQGVWNSVRAPTRSFEEHREEYVERDRSGECFFFGYRPGVKLETAEELHDRKRERERFERRNSILWWSVLVALAGVLINAVIQLITLFYSAPK